MKVSVVIPACNAERYLGEALESALGQTVPPAEVVVVDDGSTDDTASVARSFGRPVTLVRQSRAGPAAARNRGAELTSGDVLAFLDADDMWMPHKLELQLEALSSDVGLDVVFGAVEQFVSPELTAQQRSALHLTVDLPRGLAPGISVGTVLIRKPAFGRVGGFSTRWDAGEFLDWYARAMDTGLRALVLPQLVMRRRIHMTNTGVRRSDSVNDYPRVLRAVLDRRREAGQAASSSGGGELGHGKRAGQA